MELVLGFITDNLRYLDSINRIIGGLVYPRSILKKEVMENLNERRLNFLNDTIEYYSENINRRCTDEYGNCYYNPASVGKEEISEGCAIGRHLSKELKEKLDKLFGSEGAIEEVYEDVLVDNEDFPSDLISLGLVFLRDIQLLHDYHTHWKVGGLTELGELRVSLIKNQYELN